jgi:hypothetical protein
VYLPGPMIKSKFILKLTGGLGNQLFIYAFYLYMRKTTSKPIVFDVSEFSVSFRSNKLVFLIRDNLVYLKRIEKFVLRPKIQKVLKFFKIENVVKNIDEQEYFGDRKLFSGERVIAYYSGYWQYSSIVYNVLEEMRSQVVLFEDLKNDEYLNYLNQIMSSNSVSIHVRRSDYLLDLNKSTFEILDCDYYQNAMKKFQNGDFEFFVFSDDIDWCVASFSQYFPNLNFTFVNLANDILEFDLMRKCKGNILANSTFSLWAGLLNSHENKMVIAPLKYFKDNVLQFEYNNNLKFDEFTYL